MFSLILLVDETISCFLVLRNDINDCHVFFDGPFISKTLCEEKLQSCWPVKRFKVDIRLIDKLRQVGLNHYISWYIYYSLFILQRKLHDTCFFQNRCHFQYNVSRLCFESTGFVLKMITILKEMRITQLDS